MGEFEHDLKPCPFCGGEAIIREHHINPDYPERALYTVKCWEPSCYVMPETDLLETKARAVEVWNRRADNG